MKEDIEAVNFLQFRKLLKLAYEMGYTFYSGRKYSAFYLWFIKDIRGISLQKNNKMKYIEHNANVDSIEFKEFILTIHGQL